MPDLDGYEVLSQIRHDKNLDIVPFVFLAAETDIQGLRHGMELGADDYLTTPLVIHDLLAVIASQLQKQAIFIHHYHKDLTTREVMEKHRLPIAPIHELLTPRQREILKLVTQSKTTKQIAEELFISVKTVETHRGQVMERLNIHDLAGLVRYAIRVGLVDLTENETN
jgi:DNA-binding NarL/FixJ family response regulator